jgi:DNA polymerase III delta subunit
MPATMAAARPSPPDPTRPFIVLHGREHYLVAGNTRLLLEGLRKKHGEVQVFTYDGAACVAADVLDELRSYGLLGGYKLVILDNADQFLTREGHRPLMERYAAAPVDNATLLMRAETWRPGRLDKILKTAGQIIPCKEVNERDATTLCIEVIAPSHDTTIGRDAAAQLVGLIGADLARLDTEIAKLASYVGAGSPITAQAVGDLVGLGRDEQFWIMKRFVAGGRPGEAIRQLRNIIDRARNPRDVCTPVTWTILDLLRRVHGAARLLESGVPAGAVPSRLNMKWGEPKDEILAAARRLGSNAAAQLLQDAVTADMRTKTGFGDPVRTVEALTVLVTDTLSCR